ncbi:MAG: hypothetical protein ACI9FG_001347 [Crocinitomicaceae bacterium]|jgi:hypothetical protein
MDGAGRLETAATFRIFSGWVFHCKRLLYQGGLVELRVAQTICWISFISLRLKATRSLFKNDIDPFRFPIANEIFF